MDEVRQVKNLSLLDTISKTPETDAAGTPVMETDANPAPRKSRGRRRRQTAEQAWGYIAAAFAANDDECIDWPWALRVNQYPLMSINNVKYAVHRLSCALKHGEPPQGAMATHRCGRPCCINPNHLRWGDACRNAVDRNSHHTSRAKLTTEQAIQAREIKWSELETFADLCGVSPNIVASAKVGRTFGYLSGGDQQVRYEKRQKARQEREKVLANLSPITRNWHVL